MARSACLEAAQELVVFGSGEFTSTKNMNKPGLCSRITNYPIDAWLVGVCRELKVHP